MSKEQSVRPKIKTNVKKPEKLNQPLEKRNVTFLDRNGVVRNASALDERFCSPIIFPKFEGPPKKTTHIDTVSRTLKGNSSISCNKLTTGNETDKKQEWLSRVISLESSLKTLLRLPYHRFWATVNHNVFLPIVLQSYFQNGPRFFDFCNGGSHRGYMEVDDPMVSVHLSEVHFLFLSLCLRLTRVQENERNVMSPQALLGILSKNNLMDASMLMDFGALYWTTSDDHTRQLIRTMFRDVVSLDLTKYNSQFADIALGLIALIERFHEKLIGEQKSVLTKSRLIRLAYSVLDFSVTVSSLISCYPPVGRIFHENNLTARMISFHDSFFPQLQDQIKEKFSELESDFPSLNPNEDSGSDNVTFEDIKQIVLYSKQFTVLSVREIAISSCLDPLLDESIPVERKAVFFDSLIEVFTFAVTLKHFYEDYSTNYPVQKDISILAMNPHSGFSRIDPTRIEYLSKLLQDQVAESKDKELLNSYVDLQNDVQAEKSKRKKEKKAARKQTAMTSNIEKSATKDGNMGGEGGIDEVEMVSLISGIKDILPDLGEGFIELCLESFGYNNELTLNALLMDDLPDDVKGLSKQLTRQDVKGIRAITERRKSQDVTSSAPAIIVPDVIASRANIFDGDEFDIYRNKTIDFSRVHIGKKDVESVSIDDDVKKKTLLLQEKMRQEKEDEELRLMAELGITDPDDFYIG